MWPFSRKKEDKPPKWQVGQTVLCCGRARKVVALSGKDIIVQDILTGSKRLIPADSSLLEDPMRDYRRRALDSRGG